MLSDVLRHVCPRCRRGSIFQTPPWRGALAMHRNCPVCGLEFERESGYFMGAMYISYGLTLALGVSIYLAIWFITGWSSGIVLLCTVLAYLPLVPIVVRLSRVLWIYIDRSIDPGS